MTTSLWLIAAAAYVALIILLAAVARWIELSVEWAPQAATVRPSPMLVQPTSAVRFVLVTVVDGGIVLDGIVEYGNALGLPGAPVTMLLERADPCALGVAVKELKSWAAADALVEVALVAVGGAREASLRNGDGALQLPILGVRS